MSMKRIFALLLVIAMLVASFAACNKPNDSSVTTPDNTTPDTTPNIPDTPAPPSTQALKNVKIVAGGSAIESFGAAELAWYFAKKNITVSDSGYPITLALSDTVVADGYKIEADYNGLHIVGGTERGLAYGIYTFLEKFVGVQFLAADTIAVNDAEVVIGLGVLDEFVPVFDLQSNPWYPIVSLPQKDGGNDNGNNQTQTLTLGTITGNGGVAQPCLTDPENLPKAINYVKNYLAGNISVETIVFAPSNNGDLYCQCPNCARIDAEEESHAGSYLRFVNDIIEAVSDTYPNVKFAISIRTYLQTAPKITKPVDGLSVYLNTAGCHVTHPITDTSCPNAVEFAECVKTWSSLCDSAHLEYVVTSTTDYIPTFANFGSLRENMQYFAENGVKSVRCVGNFACPSGEFGELRVYLLSKLLMDPYMTEEEYYAHMDAFLASYYGGGWEYIRKFIDKTVELAKDGHQSAADSPLLGITAEEYKENKATFEEWWNKAEELAGDRIDFVKRARYQWRFVQLLVRPDSMYAVLLINDVSKTKIAWREKQWNVDASSDLFQSPDKWIYKS